MNGGNHRKWNLMQKMPCPRMGKSEVRPKYTYKMGNGIIGRVKVQKDLGVVIQLIHQQRII